MAVSTAINMGLLGMQNAMNRIDRAGARVAMGAIDPTQLATSTVTQMEGAHEVKMAANVIKAADEMLGALIDTHA